MAPSLPAQAARLPAFEPGETVTVAAVVDGGEMILADGRHVRLVGIEAPHPAAAHARAWPYAAEAKAALETLVVGQEVELRFAGNRRDRWGRILAQVFVGTRWVQGELIRRGLARVASAADNRVGIVDLLAREARARQARRGIWRDHFYAVREAGEAGRYSGSFQIVEGEVADTALVEGQLFVNFGADWRTAFSLRLSPEALRLFRREGIAAASLKGARLRVRGWVHGSERPIIDVTHPEQIERL
ncbi:MAG TPA: thermonuclease family protein [Stellaceae bacterium]|nr:thermonuclease family protein [Stellaceae bacterium]